MKKIFITLIASLCLLSACNQGDDSSEENSGKKPDDDYSIIPDGNLHYGESKKSKQTIVTMHTSYTEQTRDSTSISSIISVENASETPFDATSLSYILNDVEGEIEGKILDNKNPSDTTVEPGEKLTLNITFEVSEIQGEYTLEVEEFGSTETTPWIIKDLSTTD